MAEHWCKEHQTVFFKKGKMKGYAHEIMDAEGEGTGQWCNEPDSATASKSGKDTESPQRQTSIETQNAYTGIVQLMVAGIVKRDEPLGQTAISYATSELGSWASMGAFEESPPTESSEPKATQAQLNKIYATSKERGYDPSLATAIMLRLYDTAHSKELSKKQASDFIEKLNAGYGLDPKGLATTKLEPEDIPF